MGDDEQQQQQQQQHYESAYRPAVVVSAQALAQQCAVDMTARVKWECEETARLEENSLVGRILYMRDVPSDAEQEELRDYTRRLERVVMAEISNVVQETTDIGRELRRSIDLLHETRVQLDKVEEMTRMQGVLFADGFGIGQFGALASSSGGIDNSEDEEKMNEVCRTVRQQLAADAHLLDCNNDSWHDTLEEQEKTRHASPDIHAPVPAFSSELASNSSRPRSGRSTPLLRDAGDSMRIPTPPDAVKYDIKFHELGYTSASGHPMASVPHHTIRTSTNGDFNGSGEFDKSELTRQREKVAYRQDLRRFYGSLEHRCDAMRHLLASFDDSAQLYPVQMQMCLLYFVYSSSAARQFVFSRHCPERTKDMGAVPPSKVRALQCGLNKLTEDYHLGLIDKRNYLFSLKHLYMFNFVPIYTNDEVKRGIQACVHRRRASCDGRISSSRAARARSNSPETAAAPSPLRHSSASAYTTMHSMEE